MGELFMLLLIVAFCKFSWIVIKTFGRVLGILINGVTCVVCGVILFIVGLPFLAILAALLLMIYSFVRTCNRNQ